MKKHDDFITQDSTPVPQDSLPCLHRTTMQSLLRHESDSVARPNVPAEEVLEARIRLKVATACMAALLPGMRQEGKSMQAIACMAVLAADQLMGRLNRDGAKLSHPHKPTSEDVEE